MEGVETTLDLRAALETQVSAVTLRSLYSAEEGLQGFSLTFLLLILLRNYFGPFKLSFRIPISK